jgi:hypothetical protein
MRPLGSVLLEMLAVPVLPVPAATVCEEPSATPLSKNWTAPVGLPMGLDVPPILAGVMVSVKVTLVPTCCGEVGLALTTEAVGSPME